MPSVCGGDAGVQGREREIRRMVREQELPACVRAVLDDARAARPQNEVTCIAFYTIESGHEVARMGPETELISGRCDDVSSARLRRKDVLVLSVTVTETTSQAVRTVTHVLVARTRH